MLTPLCVSRSPACPRNTGLLLPLLVSIGIGSLFADFLESIFTQQLESLLVSMYLREKLYFWGAQLPESPAEAGIVGGSGEGGRGRRSGGSCVWGAQQPLSQTLALLPCPTHPTPTCRMLP